ncbi:glycosyltransferase family 76 protein [Patellaria atrata CBS 101060]|uniref:GPI mannosyltransferase 2 n=1 Tax=Patellaria atrata CBS 101060 TaxID=1346257 RepID=A0A9P4SHU4_9PEZI|nr:glycosyltransferase family 76 protein [Patellaria atrata CBS 101060]
MRSWSPYRRPLDDPVKSLVLLWTAWKLVLNLVAILSPFPGYDTSTTILLNSNRLVGEHENPILHSLSSKRWISNFVKWDAIYFSSIAQRGYIFEQEWAFGWGFTRLISLITRFFSKTELDVSPDRTAWVGVSISHVSHLLSVLVLYCLVLSLKHQSKIPKVAFITAVLHIISPAGLFLSAPYGESLFSLLNFSGFLLYVLSRRTPLSVSRRRLKDDVFLLVAGVCFGLATTIRSNGLFSGIIFAYDVLTSLPNILKILQDPIELRRISCTILGGISVAIGFMMPQWIAYSEYCLVGSATLQREWCTRTIPSIYTWVQEKYWNVGFLRYWTLSNLPLFLLGAPMLFLLLWSSYITFQKRNITRDPKGTKTRFPRPNVGQEHMCLRSFALVQIVLALLALTSFHFQVITRISSGYPLWYLVVAQKAVAATAKEENREDHHFAQSTVLWMVTYAVIQGGLYASFLPPA